VSDVEATGQKAEKPEGFDLEATWETVTPAAATTSE
jgi:hypothetical protein